MKGKTTTLLAVLLLGVLTIPQNIFASPSPVSQAPKFFSRIAVVSQAVVKVNPVQAVTVTPVALAVGVFKAPPSDSCVTATAPVMQLQATDLINLHEPASCFSLQPIAVQSVSKTTLTVRPQTQSVKVIILPNSFFLSFHLLPFSPLRLPEGAVPLMGLLLLAAGLVVAVRLKAQKLMKSFAYSIYRARFSPLRC